MDLQLTTQGFSLPSQRMGRPQKSGAMTMLPLFGPDHGTKFTTPLTGLKLAGVRGYGNVELHNAAPEGIVVIVPLHIGYIQDQAQNHCLCSAIFLGAGQKRLVEDACCVQQSQGGYLQEKDQWFFVLPLGLRERALQLRGQKAFGKLWDAISALSVRFGEAHRGHLEQIICRHRATLTQYQSRFELVEGQTGALFFLYDRLLGIEIAPSVAYFRELWMPLVCFCYGTAALEAEQTRLEETKPAEPFQAADLPGLREKLHESREQFGNRVQEWLTRTPTEKFATSEQERYLGLRMHTADGKNFLGQYVEDEGNVVYASLSCREAWLRDALKRGPSRS